MARYYSIQDVLNAVFADGKLNAVQSTQDILNVVYDKDRKALKVNMEGGGIPAVDDVSKLPEDAKEKDVGAVVQDGAIQFYIFTGGVWVPLSMEGGVRIDGNTITEDSDSNIQAVGVKETNKNLTQKIWVGTLQEYLQQNKQESDDICVVTDDNGSFTFLEEVEETVSTNLTFVPGKAYKWTPSSNATFSFDGSGYPGVRLEIHVTLVLNGGVTISSQSATIVGTPSSGEWTLLWNGFEAKFYKLI